LIHILSDSRIGSSGGGITYLTKISDLLGKPWQLLSFALVKNMCPDVEKRRKSRRENVWTPRSRISEDGKVES